MVKFQIDCGASCNNIPINLLNPDTKLEHTNSVLVMYNKSKLRPMGNKKSKKSQTMEFQVVDMDSAVPLLGRKASEAMKLIKVDHENIMTIDSIVTAGKPTTGQLTIEHIKTSSIQFNFICIAPIHNRSYLRALFKWSRSRPNSL